MNGFNYYRIKTNWLAEKEGGDLTKTRTEELVFATSYSEAERLAYDLIERYGRGQYATPEIEIVKTKIKELIYDSILQTEEGATSGLICCFFEEGEDTGVGLYQVKVYYTEVDEKTGKEKHSTEAIFIPAHSNSSATQQVLNFLEKVGETRDYIVRDTKFDKAEAIFWPYDEFSRQVNRLS